MGRKAINKPNKVVRKKQAKEIVENLDELFGIDEVVNIDDMMSEEQPKTEKASETIIESIGTLENLPRQSHKEDDKSALNEELSTMAKFFHQHHSIQMDKMEFELRFRYYMLKENLNKSDLTYRRVMKFLREYMMYNLDEVKKVLNSF